MPRSQYLICLFLVLGQALNFSENSALVSAAVLPNVGDDDSRGGETAASFKMPVGNHVVLKKRSDNVAPKIGHDTKKPFKVSGDYLKAAEYNGDMLKQKDISPPQNKDEIQTLEEIVNQYVRERGPMPSGTQTIGSSNILQCNAEALDNKKELTQINTSDFPKKLCNDSEAIAEMEKSENLGKEHATDDNLNNPGVSGTKLDLKKLAKESYLSYAKFNEKLKIAKSSRSVDSPSSNLVHDSGDYIDFFTKSNRVPNVLILKPKKLHFNDLIGKADDLYSNQSPMKYKQESLKNSGSSENDDNLDSYRDDEYTVSKNSDRDDNVLEIPSEKNNN